MLFKIEEESRTLKMRFTKSTERGRLSRYGDGNLEVRGEALAVNT
jgi:hypothetical protein